MKGVEGGLALLVLFVMQRFGFKHMNQCKERVEGRRREKGGRKERRGEE